MQERKVRIEVGEENIEERTCQEHDKDFTIVKDSSSLIQFSVREVLDKRMESKELTRVDFMLAQHCM